MAYIIRKIQPKIQTYLDDKRNILLLGPRQTGKTMMLSHISADLIISFAQPDIRLQHEKDLGLLINRVKHLANSIKKYPLVILDEIQKIPALMDAVQYLIDNQTAQFILTGSSARKLKHGKHINLLPGRVLPIDMHPLAIDEVPKLKLKLDDLLLLGSLPGIVNENNIETKQTLLTSYVTLYLEEEIRLEALVRNIASFAHFLELAASESGYLINFNKLSKILGIAQTTVVDYFQILDDCLIVKRIEPLLQSKTRHKLSKSPKYLFFDLGLRRVAAKEGLQLPEKQMGHLFEQFVGLELIRYASRQSHPISIKYWRDLNGPEVDWVVKIENRFMPIEVKYTDKPSLSDARHLKLFLKEYQEEAQLGFIVCRIPHRRNLAENIVALPWQELPTMISDYL